MGFPMYRSVQVLTFVKTIAVAQVEELVEELRAAARSGGGFSAFTADVAVDGDGLSHVAVVASAREQGLLVGALAADGVTKPLARLKSMSSQVSEVVVCFDAEAEPWNADVREVWTELRDVVAAAHTALLVIDIQNDYCSPGGARASESFLEGVDPIREPLIEQVAAARAAGVPIIYTLTQTDEAHDHGPVHARRRRVGLDGATYTIPGTWGWNLCDFAGAEEGDLMVPKWRHSAFSNPTLDAHLRELGVKTVVLTGAATNGCVEATARDGFARGFYVVVVRDCVATYDQQLHDASLQNMANHFAIIADSNDVASAWAEKVVAAAGS